MPLAWEEIPGKAVDIAAGSRGKAAAVDPEGAVFLRESGGGRWRLIGRGMRRVAIDGQGHVWGIDREGALRRFTDNEWRAYGTGAADLAPAAGGHIVVASDSGGIAQLDVAKESWQVVPGRAQKVAVDARGLIWTLASDGTLARRLGGTWIGVPGKARDIAADGSGRVLMVGEDGKLHEWRDERAVWEEMAGSGDSIAVAVAGGTIWRVDSLGRIHASGLRRVREDAGDSPPRREGARGTRPVSRIADTSPLVFTRVAGGLKQLAIGLDGSVFGLETSGSIRRWSNAEKRFNGFPGNLNVLGVSASGLPFGLGPGGNFARHDGAAWRNVPLRFGLIDLTFANEQDALAINVEGQLFRLSFKDGNASYQRLPGDGTRIAVAPDGSYWYRNGAGLLFRCDLLNQCQRLSVNASDLAVGPAGTVFIVDDQFNLRRFNAETGLFDILRRGSTLRVAVGPGDRPWIIERNGDVLASVLFERDESQDAALARGSVSTATVTQTEVPAPASAVVIGQNFRFIAVDIPSSAPGFPVMSTFFRDITVGQDDQIIVTGYDESADPCRAQAEGWKGSNWVYSPTQRKFLHLDFLKRVQYQLIIAARNLSAFGGQSTPPAIAGAPAINAIYASLRGCQRYYSVQYSATTFAGSSALFSEGGLAFLESNLGTSQLTANSRDITLTLDHDITLDDWFIAIYPERKINFVRIGAGFNTSDPIELRSDQKFARIGVGATRNVIWATDVDSNVYEFVPASNAYVRRNLLDADRAQDVGVGKDGSVFIVDVVGRLKKWNPALKSFVYAGKSGVTRVAVTSKGKPVVANFPASPRVYIAE